MTARQKALLIAEIAKDKKAENIVILDMRKLSNITDFFIIAAASSKMRAQTITSSIEECLVKAKEPLAGIEGYKDAGWIVIDAYNVVTHIFSGELRSFYNLERLWSDAPRVRLCRLEKKKTSKKTSGKK